MGVWLLSHRNSPMRHHVDRSTNSVVFEGVDSRYECPTKRVFADIWFRLTGKTAPRLLWSQALLLDWSTSHHHSGS